MQWLGKQLVEAASEGSDEVDDAVEYLLGEGAPVNFRNSDGATALIEASTLGDLYVVDVLLDQQQIDVNAQSNNGHTALIRASAEGHLKVVGRLLRCERVDVNCAGLPCPFGWTALHMASLQGHLDVVNRLLNCEQIDVNMQDWTGSTAMMVASERGHEEVANRLLVFQKVSTTREGFELLRSHGSLHVPADLIELIVEFSCAYDVSWGF